MSGEVVLPGPERTGDVHRRISEYVQWLRDVAALGRRLADDARLLGIFGTSIAATWLAAQLQDRVAFFVDEDGLPGEQEELLALTHAGAQSGGG